jgi:TetR/AcrR family transcriptional regulator, mexJK operon transcriptional repressor
MRIRFIRQPLARAITPIAAKKRRNATPAAARRGGRPPRTAALLLRERILDVATALFLNHGYGLTSIEAVARQARVSKRTFYHRFADKTALFEAVVHRIIEGIRPPADVPLIEGATLHAILKRLSQLILHAALSPAAIALHRLVIAESARFPELARATSAQGASQEAIALISNVLAHEIHNESLDAPARNLAAAQFLQLVIAIPQRRALSSHPPMTASEVDRWTDAAVELFLNGCRGWSRG